MNQSINCFARITDITLKSDEQLAVLKKAGFNGLTMGMETAEGNMEQRLQQKSVIGYIQNWQAPICSPYILIRSYIRK